MAPGISFQGFLFVLALALPCVVSKGGTPQNIEGLILERCTNFLNTRMNQVNKVNVDCADLKTEFFKAFRYKAECGVKEEDFQPFVKAAKQPIPANKALFWSGADCLAHGLSDPGKRVTLADTLTGYLAKGLQFCGQISPPGINYTRCPEWKECKNSSYDSARDTFWNVASETFAQEAMGEVWFLLNSSDPNGTYRKNSCFGTHELPFLKPPRVSKIHVYVSYRPGDSKKETCDNGSVLKLRSDVKANNVEFVCKDGPETDLNQWYSEDPDNGNYASMAVFSYPVTGLLPLVVTTWFSRYFQN